MQLRSEITENSPESLQYLVWVGPNSAWSEQVAELCPFPVQVEAFELVEDAAEWLQKHSGALVFVEQELRTQSARSALAQLKNASPYSPHLVVVHRLDEEFLLETLNQGIVDRFISYPWVPGELQDVLQWGANRARNFQDRAELLEKVRTQNKQLQRFTDGLEREVQERTVSAEASKKEAEKKLASMRELVNFIKDLSTINSIEDLLLLIDKSARKFSGTRAPVLFYQGLDNQPVLSFIQGRTLVEKRVPRGLFDTGGGENQEARQKLANIFERPFGSVIAVPLLGTSSEAEGEDLRLHATLFLEHVLPEDRARELRAHFNQKLHPLMIALSRILLSYHLKYSSYQWESTFDSILDPVAIIDVDYNTVRANSAFAKSDGKLGKCYERLAGANNPCAGCPAGDAYRTGEPAQGTVQVAGKTYQVYSYPIKVKGSEAPTNLINHYVDISAQNELRSRAVQSEKMAAIGLLAGNIAHELNNPLTGVRSLCQVLLADLEPESALHNDLMEVEKAAARCQKIIENLLSFSRPTETQNGTVVDLNSVIEKTLPMLKTALREHRSEILLGDETIRVRSDVQLMQQVVFNLVNNACQAMQEPGTVTVSTRLAEIDGQMWGVLEVRDTGPGIPPEIADRIFEPFFTTKEEGEGTGLGLSMSRSIVEEFGGVMTVESEPGIGACFTVRLPFMGSHDENSDR